MDYRVRRMFKFDINQGVLKAIQKQMDRQIYIDDSQMDRQMRKDGFFKYQENQNAEILYLG